MKILITGASGKLGTRLRAALGTKHELVLLSHLPIDAPGTKNYVADLNDRDLMTGIMADERPEAIIHLSAIVGPECESNETLAKKINIEATRILAELATEYSVGKFIFASTAAVYRQTSLEPTDEKSNVDPQTVYGKTKLAAEKVLQETAKDSITQFIVFRIFNIYGSEFTDSLVNKLLDSTREQPVTLLEPDNCYRDYIHAEDVVTAIVKALQVRFSTNYCLMNIASGVAISNAELVEAIKLHGTTPHFTIQPSGLNVLWADISQAREVIGFRPSKSLELKTGRLYI